MLPKPRKYKMYFPILCAKHGSLYQKGIISTAVSLILKWFTAFKSLRQEEEIEEVQSGNKRNREREEKWICSAFSNIISQRFLQYMI